MGVVSRIHFYKLRYQGRYLYGTVHTSNIAMNTHASYVKTAFTIREERQEP